MRACASLAFLSASPYIRCPLGTKLLYKGPSLNTRMAPAPEIVDKRAPQTRRREGPLPLRRKQVQPPPTLPQWRRSLNFLLVFVTIVLVVDALIGEKGLVETIRARRQSRELAASVERLRAGNAR